MVFYCVNGEIFFNRDSQVDKNKELVDELNRFRYIGDDYEISAVVYGVPFPRNECITEDHYRRDIPEISDKLITDVESSRDLLKIFQETYSDNRLIFRSSPHGYTILESGEPVLPKKIATGKSLRDAIEDALKEKGMGY